GACFLSCDNLLLVANETFDLFREFKRIKKRQKISEGNSRHTLESMRKALFFIRTDGEKIGKFFVIKNKKNMLRLKDERSVVARHIYGDFLCCALLFKFILKYFHRTQRNMRRNLGKPKQKKFRL
ncbi:MAG: hypothetical protein QXY94_00280, partial [Archaeoglobaceae archaeon]